ncbi:MAG: cbb3-type cytochrome c oxidase subunit 3 [Betaproteobacteria bacterium]|nr:cbb3-type cytochrome c oxidase subunit 3 [Betaproteobacteria bacterium]MBL8532517.1 cbb3-type cytochrome c oxidase subunit 3 [Betaproteobacteria bacterium]
MDISVADVRSWMTVVQFVVFLGIVWWAFGAARKGRFEEAAKLALEDDDPVVQTGTRRGGQK